MQTIEQGLGRAASDGVISGEQAERLLAYLVAPADDGRGAADTVPPDTETPRFIRGFHDVLITIGIIILLSGVAGLGSVLALPPIILVLTEILVRRQRLALPAVVLTAAFAISLVALSTTFLADEIPEATFGPLYKAIVLSGPVLLALAFYAWRYRVPVAIATLFMSASCFAALLVLTALSMLMGEKDLLTSYPFLSAAVLFAAALALFALAMRYDLSDPQRVTRRSDIAFWLHLATAPALLYSCVNLLLPISGGRFMPTDASRFGDGPIQIAIVVTIMVMIGIVIDRRAFVTSGLVSLIIAFAAFFNQGLTSLFRGNSWAIATLVVGLLVLTLGIGWHVIRRYVVEALPDAWQRRLPPVK